MSTRTERPLKRDEKRTVALLGVPTLALALVVTLVTTYLPVVAQEFVRSTVVVGLIVGIEGLVALWLPLVVGSSSDRLHTRLGGRVPFLIAGAPVVVIGLLAMSVVSSVAALAGAALVFFVGYFLAYEPYRALYPDAVGDEIAGRSQGTQALFRGAGTGIALVSGGLLLGIGRGAPFVAGAVVFAASIAVFAVALARRGVPSQRDAEQVGVREATRQVLDLVRGNGALQAFLLANGLWELSLAALETFVVLYVMKGLGYGRVSPALIIGAGAALVLLAALLTGKLADRYGRLRVLQVAVPVHRVGLRLLLVQPRDGHLARLAARRRRDRSRGRRLLEHAGLPAVWGVCAVAVLLSLWPLRRLRAHAGE
jgi:Na+/melibiose symporter-like transporter